MISIIMPLFNAERFLEETLKSIARQTYRDYELICVDDASTDLTAEIVKKAQFTDGRIILLHNDKREGAAFSRNKGLSQAKGDYLSFLDGDDIYDADMLEKAYECAENNKLDIVIFEYKHASSEKVYQKQYIYRNENFKRKYCERSFKMESLSAEEYCLWSNSPWNKLFRTKFIIDNKLEFQSLSSSNDVYFVEMAFLLAERIMNIDDNRVMVYARDHDTPTRISHDRDPMCTYYAWYRIIEEILKRQLLSKLYEHCYLKCYFALLGGLAKTKAEDKKEKFYTFLQERGINQLKDIGQYYSLLPERINVIFEKFIMEDYNSKWFETENLVTYLIQKKENRFRELFNEYVNVFIWGAGNYGGSLVHYLQNAGLEIKGILDSNISLEGKLVGKYNILGVQKVDFRKIDLVIVAARGAFQEVNRMLIRYNNVKIIDLGELIGI